MQFGQLRRRELITLLGGAAAWLSAARAQQAALPVIGFLNGGSAALLRRQVSAFHQGLQEAGYVEGANVAVDYRFAEGQFDRLQAMAEDLVLLCHRTRRIFRVKRRVQHGQRGSVRAIATSSLR